ncbi:MAG: protein-disulfide reductase DsbD domain-containing protein [Acidobacteriota bacterium]
MRRALGGWLLLLLVGGAVPVRAAAGAWAANPQSQVRLISPYAVAGRTGEFRFGVEFKLTPGWHAYWRNSGDAGFPPALVVKAAQVRDAELLFPAPRRFELRGGLVAFGYEDAVVYPVKARLEGASGARLTIPVSLDYVVCADECVPYRYDLTLDQPLGDVSTPDAALAELLFASEAQLPLSESAAHLKASALLVPGDAGHATLNLAIPVGSRPGADIFFLPHDRFQLGKPVVTVGSAITKFSIPLDEKRLPAPPLTASDFAWTATGLALADSPGVGAVAGTTRAVPVPTSVFPGIVLWPLVGAFVLVLLVLAFARRTRHSRSNSKETSR